VSDDIYSKLSDLDALVASIEAVVASAKERSVVLQGYQAKLDTAKQLIKGMSATETAD
jgi:nitroimidazol reductase NimA-like FMN-containing flavoprotein (pyridoxamine 5'-phosphate oxidase superfamily)